MGLNQGLKKQNISQAGWFSTSLTRKCYTYLIKPLTFVTNLSLSTGTFPENLKTSKMKPLFKNGSTHEIDNYRPF
jgi:hypothetical protein